MLQDGRETFEYAETSAGENICMKMESETDEISDEQFPDIQYSLSQQPLLDFQHFMQS